MGRKKKDEGDDFSLDRMMAEMAARLKDSTKKPNNLMYKPHRKQILFHTSDKNGRQYIGGNRSGKTTAGINEDVWWLTGRHPYLDIPKPPVFGRITTVDFKTGAATIIIPNLKQWLAPSDLINGSWEDSYNGSEHMLKLANGSELEIKSYDQELEKFAGVPRHFTHFDEEPPFDIFKECKARLVDYDGRWWMTMTPVDGMTWTFEEIYDPSEDGSNDLIEVIKVNIRDNPHLSKKAIDNLLEGFSEDEQEIRGTGRYIAVSGLVFKYYNPDKHVLEGDVVPPASWRHYITLDPGYNNPAAVLFHAVGPNEQVVTYDEIYVREHTVKQISTLITIKEDYYREHYGIVPFLKIIDAAAKQRQQSTGLSIQIEYAQNGHNFTTPKSRDVAAGLDKMNDYLRLNKWMLTEKTPNLQREMRMYKRADYSTSKLKEKNNRKEEPQKKNDHACDSSRYLFQFMPVLNIEEELKRPLLTKEQVASMMGPGTTFNPAAPFNTDRALSSIPQNTIIHDEYVGEW
jgi:phage terminase large subunit-like protein